MDEYEFYEKQIELMKQQNKILLNYLKGLDEWMSYFSEKINEIQKILMEINK